MAVNDAREMGWLYIIIAVAIIMIAAMAMLDRYLTHLEKTTVKVVKDAKD